MKRSAFDNNFSHDVFIARQPIFDRDLKVFGYELLFRHADAQQASFVDGDQATSQVILNAFTVIGLDELVGANKAFINMTRGFLLRRHPLPFPIDRVVLEVLEDIEPDQELVQAVEALAGRGFTISLDDFVFNESLLPLVELADIIKVDTALLTAAELEEHVSTLRTYKAKLLAEKVETQEGFDYCHALGFDYFQGYFLERPRVLQKASLVTSRLPVLRLLSALHRPEVDVSELEDLIGQDISLSYKLLRYLNSAFFSLPRHVESIRQAIVYLGVNELRTWVSLLMLATATTKPPELMMQLMARAKMCESLARRLQLTPVESYFTVGLFSGLDSLLDAPLDEILPTLPLGDELVAALTNQSGTYGRILECALSYEHGNWDRIGELGIAADVVIAAYFDALRWSNELRELWDSDKAS